MRDSSIGNVALLAIAAAAGSFGACGGDDAAESVPDSGSESSDSGSPPDAEAPPPTKAGGLAYHDNDFRKGFLGNEVSIKKADKESDVLEYRVYFGSSPQEKLVGSPLGVTPSKGVDVSIPVPKDTRLPDGATHLLVYTVSAKGEESPSPVATPLRDNVLESRVLTTDDDGPPPALGAPSIALDAKNKRVIFGGSSDALKLQLVVCDDALEKCTAHDASLGVARSASSTAIFVDTARERIAAITSNLSESGTSDTVKLRYTSCALDGTACAASDISGGKSNYHNIDVALDAASQRLYIASIDYYYGKPLSLVRCRLDGTDCSSKILAPKDAGVVPNIMLDPIRKQLLVTTTDSGNYKLIFHRCDFDGDRCSMTNADAKQPDFSGFGPRSVFDDASGQVLTVTRREPMKSSLFRCDAKTAQCSHEDVSAGQSNDSHEGRASLALYAETASFVFVVSNPLTHQLSLVHCKTDGTNCAHTLLSEEAGYGTDHSMIVDPTNDRVIVVARQNAGTGARTSLFTFRPW